MYEPVRVFEPRVVADDEEDDDEFNGYVFFTAPKRRGKGLYVPQRYVLAFMGFLAMANAYIQRFCLSLAITEMVLPHSHVAATGTKVLDPYACPGTLNATAEDDYVSWAEFDWSEKQQGIILSAVFWGYVLTQLPGGLLAERYGGKQVLGLGLLTSTLGTLLTPSAARLGANWLIAVRFLIGLGQGTMYPSVNVMLAQWAPPEERGRLGAAVFAGAQIGNVVSMAVGGLLMRYVDGGWQNVFYVFGTAGLVWCAVFQAVCYSEPSSHPFISDAERTFLLERSVGSLKSRQDLPATPWRRILTSVPLWGLVVAQIGHDWGLFTIITDLPKYMKSVMHFSIAQNGLLSAAPYLVMWIVALVSGVFVDFLVHKNFSISLVRKIFISIAATGPALGILGATYSGCDRVLVVTFFTGGMGLMGAFVPSLKVNCLDLSPNYAGTLMALVGGVGAVSGIITPYLVGLLTPNNTLLEWRFVFWVAVIVLVATNVVYLFLGSGEVQPWNDPLTTESKRPSIVTSRADSILKKSTVSEKTEKTGEAKT